MRKLWTHDSNLDQSRIRGKIQFAGGYMYTKSFALVAGGYMYAKSGDICTPNRLRLSPTSIYDFTCTSMALIRQTTESGV